MYIIVQITIRVIFFFFFVVVNELSEELTFHGILMMDDLEWIQ